MLKKPILLLLLAMMCSFFACGTLLSKEAGDEKRKPPKIADNNPDTAVRIGYFHGGRIHLFWRAYVNNFFEDEGVNVKLYSEYFGKDGFKEFPKSFEEMKEKSFSEDGEQLHFGRITGVRIIEAMDKGILDGGTVGEASFLYCVAHGSRIVAVAKLGSESKSEPSKALIMRKDVLIKRPEDFKGKVLMSSKAGPIDAILLREFIESIGLDPEKDVTIIDQVPHHEQGRYLREKKADGALVHAHTYVAFLKKGLAYLYRKMDWVNPEISQGVLVFRKDFVDAYPEKVEKIVLAYMKRIKFEEHIPEKEKTKEKRFGLQMELHFEGVQLPLYDFPPVLREDLLSEVQRLLLKYHYLDNEVDLKKCVDNTFVEKANARFK